MNPLELWASDVGVNKGNLSSKFYKVDEPSKESGSAASVFDYAFGVSSGFEFVELTWEGSPQPEIDQASLKAGNFHVIWGAEFFTAFNGSLGVYDGIRMYQDGIMNKPRNSFLGISHANLEGQLGSGPEDEPVGVPDSGRSLLLMGLGIGFLGLFHRFARK